VPSTALPCGNISPVVGITSTPVIDPGTGAIYVVADTSDSGIRHRLYGLNLGDGTRTAGLPVTVDPPGSIPANQLQRAAIALDVGRVIVGYGGNDGDCGTYHGWLVAAAENGAGSLLTFEVDASGNGGAVWGAGNGPAVDSSGAIWASTGNGSSSSYGFQESVLKLGASLSLLDWWAPSNWQFLDNNDVDLGSSDPLLLPGGLVFQIGKEGVGYLLSAASLGHTGAAPRFQAPVCSGSFGGGIYWGGVIYVACSDGIHALALNTSAPSFSSLSGWSVNGAAIGPPILAGGLVWSAGWSNGVLYGLSPTSGATAFSADLGSFHHFTSPSAGGGRLFVANGNKVTAFAIATPPASSGTGPGASSIPPPTISHIRIKVRSGRARLTFTLSEAAKVTVVVRRILVGRSVGGRCRLHATRGQRCLVSLRRATLRLSGKRGVDSFRLRMRPLPAGRHSATLVARDAAGRRSRAYKVTFRVRPYRGIRRP
jgi:hypothetical protein